MIDVENPRYRRAVPTEWAGLLDNARERLDGEISPTPETARSLMTVIDDLDTESLDENRYYALGLAMCGYARRLADVPTQDKAVVAASDHLVKATLWNNRRNRLPIALTNYLGAGFMHIPFEVIAKEAYDELDPEVRFLSDALTVNASKKARQHLVEAPMPGDGDRITDIVETGPTKYKIAANALAGASLVTKRLVEQIEGHKGERPTAEQYVKRLKADDPESYERVHAIMLRSAGLRLDEIRDAMLMREIIKLDSSGNLEFDHSAVPKPPREATFMTAGDDTLPALLHQKRLRCPAVHVEGLVPLTADLMPPILVRSEKLLRSLYPGRGRVTL